MDCCVFKDPSKSVPLSFREGNDQQRSLGHRSTRSVSSLPSDLQKLSLYTPSSVNTSPAKDDSSVLRSGHHRNGLPNVYGDGVMREPTAPQRQQQQQQQQSFHVLQEAKIPSWLHATPPADPHRPVVLPRPSSSSSAFTSHTLHQPIFPAVSPPRQHRRPPGASHGRSVSEYTLPPPLQLIPQPARPVDSQQNLRARHQTHRRAISANTVDFLINHPPSESSPPSSSSSSSASSHLVRAVSDSPPEKRLASPTLKPQQDHPTDEQRENSTGRYLCPYCRKAFSRPSSLRIHTYSHTGEKPFVCPEEGCGRRFSVQSNMRRHLRVHRLGRSTHKVKSPLSKH